MNFYYISGYNAHMRFPFRRIAAATLALTQLSCAVGGGLQPLPQSMPAARAALQPEYRVFYDALTDYGDWTLIQPYGYVFRPRVAVAQWRPYGDGFWVPTDLYGWVWVSAEPFGWATYHYGQWFYDQFQGWVWLPGVDWAPAWVDWRATDTYVGWAPTAPRGASSSAVPGGAFTYVAADELAETDLKNHTVSANDLGEAAAQARPIQNIAESSGVRFNRGPSLQWIERVAGPLNRARIDDVAPAISLAAPSGMRQRARGDLSSKTDRPADSLVVVQRAAEKAAREARLVTEQGSAPPERLSMVRPFGVPKVQPSYTPPSMARPLLPRPKRTPKQAASPDSAR
jgi:hypothetical protein